MKRRQKIIPDDRHLMTLSFIETISPQAFIAEAKKVHSLREISRFYGNQLETEEDLRELLQ